MREASPVALCRSDEKFQQARLVEITHWGLATWLDPLGMLEPQVVANLLPELGKRMKLARRNFCVVELSEYVVRRAHAF